MLWFLRPGVTLDYVIMRVLSVLLIVFVILPLHEFAHGFVASKLGDNTAKYNGRLTLNPVSHLDPLGALAMLLFGFGWARPVPIDPRNFKNPRAGMAITAAAGPVSNLLAALLGAFIYYGLIAAFYGSMSPFMFKILGEFFLSYISINVGLAIFNLLPIPPLDGSKIIAILLPERLINKYYQYQNVIIIIVFLLLFTGILSFPLSILQNLAYNGIMKIAILPFKSFLGVSLGV